MDVIKRSWPDLGHDECLYVAPNMDDTLKVTNEQRSQLRFIILLLMILNRRVNHGGDRRAVY